MLAAMTAMQQQIDAQFKLIVARLAALESGTTAHAVPVEQAAKKRKGLPGALAPSPSPPEDDAQEPDAEDADEDERDGTTPVPADAPMAAAATVSPTKHGNNKRSHANDDGDAMFLRSAERSAGAQ
jgi:hypothetical protein